MGHINRLFKAAQKTVFNAIAEGILFKCTGTTDKSHFDFRGARICVTRSVRTLRHFPYLLALAS